MCSRTYVLLWNVRCTKCTKTNYYYYYYHSVATLKHAMKKIWDTEEADTRIFVHARDATQDGCKSLIIKANDTDVVIIAVSVLPSLQQLVPSEHVDRFWTRSQRSMDSSS